VSDVLPMSMRIDVVGGKWCQYRRPFLFL